MHPPLLTHAPARPHPHPHSGRHTLVIPSGGPALNGWVALRDCVRRVAAYVEEGGADAPAVTVPSQSAPPGAAGPSGSHQPPLPPQRQRQQQQAAAGGSAPELIDVSYGPTVGPAYTPPLLSTSPQGTPVLSVAGRRVFFDVGGTPRGDFMRITQVANQDRCGRPRAQRGGGRAALAAPAALCSARHPLLELTAADEL